MTKYLLENVPEPSGNRRVKLVRAMINGWILKAVERPAFDEHDESVDCSTVDGTDGCVTRDNFSCRSSTVRA